MILSTTNKKMIFVIVKWNEHDFVKPNPTNQTSHTFYEDTCNFPIGTQIRNQTFSIK